jgi:hypothetical protein
MKSLLLAEVWEREPTEWRDPVRPRFCHRVRWRTRFRPSPRGRHAACPLLTPAPLPAGRWGSGVPDVKGIANLDNVGRVPAHDHCFLFETERRRAPVAAEARILRRIRRCVFILVHFLHWQAEAYPTLLHFYTIDYSHYATSRWGCRLFFASANELEADVVGSTGFACVVHEP